MEMSQLMGDLMTASYSQLVTLLRVSIAMALGSLIGFERERMERPAGLRTHMLVAGAAALFVSLGDVLTRDFSIELNQGAVRTDPIRVIEAIVTGVSFLGAGTIIRDSGQIHGLTTAASLLFSAAIGLSVALGQFVLAVGLAGLALLTLRGLRRLEP